MVISEMVRIYKMDIVRIAQIGNISTKFAQKGNSSTKFVKKK